MVTQGVAAMGQYGVLIGSVPSLIFLFAFSRQRNAQFIFLFCLCDTVYMWVELASGLIDYAVGGGGVVTLILRLVTLPLLEYAVWRWLRRPFLEMSHIVRHSWLLFALMTGVCYLILVVLSVYPTIIFQRPQDIPLAVMVLVLIALAYTTIFIALFEQYHMLETQERQRVFEAQAIMMEITNPYAGKVAFDREGLPVSDKPGHGIGTRSIVAFAEKYDALCRFQAEDGWFKVQLAV